MRILWRCLLTLAIIWVIAGSVLLIIHATRPTPQKFIAYVNDHPVDGLDSGRRRAIVERAAHLLNALSFDQRKELRESGSIRNFFIKLSKEERNHFLRLTVPEGFRQLVTALNKMEPNERKRLSRRTLRNLQRHPEEAANLTQDKEIQVMISEGVAQFNRDAQPQVKEDFAPVIEELLKKHLGL